MRDPPRKIRRRVKPSHNTRSRRKIKPSNTGKDNILKFLRNHGLQIIAATALIAGTAAAVKVTHDRNQTYNNAKISYIPPKNDYSPWIIPNEKSDKLHPVVSETNLTGTKEEFKILVVDWVYDKDRENNKYYESGKQEALTEETRGFLQNAWENNLSRLVTFVRHPYSCANEAKAKGIWGNLSEDRMHTWWFSDPLATTDGFLQALDNAKDTFSRSSIQYLLHHLKDVFTKNNDNVASYLEGALENNQHQSAVSFYETRASPMIRATSGALAILAATDIKVDGSLVNLEPGILEKQQFYDQWTDKNTPTQNKLVPEEAKCTLKRLDPLLKLNNLSLEGLNNLDEQRDANGTFALDDSIEAKAKENKFNIWLTHGGFMRKLFKRKQMANNEAICVLVTKGYYNPETRVISNDSTLGEERTIMQIIASAKPQEDLTTDKGKVDFAQREGISECQQFIDGIINGKTIDPPKALVELLTGNKTHTRDLTQDLNKQIANVVRNILFGCLTKEDEEIWAKQHCKKQLFEYYSLVRTSS